MRLAWLFPGQGLKGLVPAVAFAMRSTRGCALLEHAAASAGLSLDQLLERAGAALERTEVQQPVLTATALFIDEELRSAGFSPAFVAGHSLGELAAWASAAGVPAEDAIRIASARGALMARAARERPGGMVALVEADEARVERGVELGRSRGAIEVAAHNAPGEVVLSGDEPALRAVLAALPSKRLDAAGPWHSAAMSDAARELRCLFPARYASAPRAVLVSSLNGEATAIADGPDSLCEQLTRPVEWTRTMATLSALGARDFVVVGPGAVLAALVRRNVTDARVYFTESSHDLSRTVAALRAEL